MLRFALVILSASEGSVPTGRDGGLQRREYRLSSFAGAQDLCPANQMLRFTQHDTTGSAM